MRCPPTLMLVPEWFLLIAAVAIIAIASGVTIYYLTLAAATRQPRRRSPAAMIDDLPVSRGGLR